MPVTYREETPDRNDYFTLFQTTGWNNEYRASPEDLEKANRSSWFSVSAYDGENLVGFGRVVTDFVLHAMIYDMIVLSEYQGKGIGTRILKTLVNHCAKHGIRDIQLFSAKGKRPFYERNGFKARPDDAPGMQLSNAFE